MTEKKLAIITIGVSASGKSTWANKYIFDHPEFVEINRDNIRRELVHFILKEDFSWHKWNRKWESKVTEEFWKRIDYWAPLPSCEGIIISDTNLNRKHRAKLISTLMEKNFRVEIKIFHVESLQEAIRRDLTRRNPVGSSVIARQMDQFNKEFPPEWVYTPDHNKTSAVIFDLDGTLAHSDGKRSMYEWDKVDLDSVDEHVKMVLVSLFQAGKSILILSGRDGVCREKTEQWLGDNGIPYNHLYMREQGNTEKDYIIKQRILRFSIAPFYNVQMVFDDRPIVCDMWRSIGLKVFHLGNPHVRF